MELVVLLFFLLMGICAVSAVNEYEAEECTLTTEVAPYPIHIPEAKSLQLNFTLTSDCSVRVEFVQISSTDEDIFTVQNYQLISNNSIQHSWNIVLYGFELGIAKMKIRVTFADASFTELESFVKVQRQDSAFRKVFDILLIIWMFVTYITMGVKIDVHVLWERFKRPVEVSIGAFCQFVIMPGLAFALAKALKLDNISAIGLVTDGSCPGGWLSNILSLLLNIDFALSLTMTAVSTVLAIGTMPLNLFLYARPFIPEDDKDITIPYTTIALQLLLLVAPVLVGILIRMKSAKLTKVCETLLRPFATFLIIVALGFGIPSELYVFYSSWEIYTAAAALPMIGASLGLALSKVLRLDSTTAATIALETGVQNGLLAKALISMSFPNPEADLMARLPLLISLLTLMEGLVIALLKFMWEYSKTENNDDMTDKDDKKHFQRDVNRDADMPNNGINNIACISSSSIQKGEPLSCVDNVVVYMGM